MVCDGKLAATECCAAESAMLGRGGVNTLWSSSAGRMHAVFPFLWCDDRGRPHSSCPSRKLLYHFTETARYRNLPGGSSEISE